MYTHAHSSVVVRRTKAASSSYMPGREGDPKIDDAFVLQGDSKGIKERGRLGPRLSTRGLLIDKLSSCVALSPGVQERALHFLWPTLLAMPCQCPSRRLQKDWVWASPGVYLVFPIAWFLIGFRCEYPIEALNK